MEEGGLCERLVRFTKIDIKIKYYLDAWNSKHESKSCVTVHCLSLALHKFHCDDSDAQMNVKIRQLCLR